jgi:hypothetical protein
VSLYLLTLQLLVGIALIVIGFRAPVPHYALALCGWAGYMFAAYLSRQEDSRQNVLIVTILASAMILLAAFVGVQAAGPA